MLILGISLYIMIGFGAHIGLCNNPRGQSKLALAAIAAIWPIIIGVVLVEAAAKSTE